VGSVAFSIISYYSYKAKVEPYFICIINIVKMALTAKEIEELNISWLESYNSSLKSIASKMSKVTGGAGMLASTNENGSIAEILLDYLRMITHIDLIRFNSMLKSVNSLKSEVYEMIRILGFLESTIAIASYRESLDYWCRPQFMTGSRSMSVEAVYHPCIENPVANSISVNRNVLLTGSNASGKSTFLKTVAINALLSQSICTSLSKRYTAPVFRIYSSMALKDNLEGHDSYYIVEIKSLKRILDSIDEGKTPVLCFVDEVLRGTNTVERIAASSQILKSLAGRNVICFAATHDIELTKMLESFYDNYHFQEDFNEDVVFNYKLLQGAASSRNAIKLLKGIGYDAAIIKAADDCANRFLQTGDWC
jgi:DNA mismatch repair ATPase MutS